MHIYDKQCDLMQKNQWKGSNFQIQCFYNGRSLTDRSSLLKTRKTREIKMLITQNSLSSEESSLSSLFSLSPLSSLFFSLCHSVPPEFLRSFFAFLGRLKLNRKDWEADFPQKNVYDRFHKTTQV